MRNEGWGLVRGIAEEVALEDHLGTCTCFIVQQRLFSLLQVLELPGKQITARFYVENRVLLCDAVFGHESREFCCHAEVLEYDFLVCQCSVFLSPIVKNGAKIRQNYCMTILFCVY